MTQYPRYRVAAAHVAPVFLDADATVSKACDVIAEAARNGARLVAFAEGFIPGFPVWVALQAPTRGHEPFRALAAQALMVDGPEIARIRETARQHDVVVSLGFTEGTTASVGCLWNSNIIIGSDGNILNHHRKLVPTFYEKLIWANGDGNGLRVTSTELGRIGMLICGENTNPLARYALMADGEQVHISTYPPVWPTRPPGDNGNYDLAEAIRIRAGAHSFEAKVFNIVVSSPVDETLFGKLADFGIDAEAALANEPRGLSMVLGPTGARIGDTAERQEKILYAEIDLAASVEPKQFHDVVGYYNRFDVFHLRVNRSENRPAAFSDDETRGRRNADNAASPEARRDDPSNTRAD
jgi:aliphatic nitrilase